MNIVILVSLLSVFWVSAPRLFIYTHNVTPDLAF